MDWFLCDNGPRHERVKRAIFHSTKAITLGFALVLARVQVITRAL